MDTRAMTTEEAAARVAAMVENEADLDFLVTMREEFPDAEWYLVGGAVRDALLGRETKDFDVVARNVSLQELAEALAAIGKVNFVGRNFGVLKFRPEGAVREVDIAWPRTERAGGSGGYRDFAVQSDPELPIERDLARRDFTVNAIAWDVFGRRFIDPFGGKDDLAKRIIRAVGEPSARFAEDYSRMLRCVRFACQLGFEVEPATWDAVSLLAPRINDLRDEGDGRHERIVPWETVAREFVKAMAADPSRAVDMLEGCGALFMLVPELEPLSGCEQSSDHHGEGDVWTHTKLALSKLRGAEFSGIFPGDAPSVEAAIATLLHDVAKPLTAAKDGDRITFYGHAERGAEIARAVGERLRLASVDGADISVDRLAWLVKMHLFPNLVKVDEVKRTTLVRHFISDRTAGRELLHLACADALGTRPAGGAPDLSNLGSLLRALDAVEQQHVAAPGPLVGGDEVMAIAGIGPGPEIGRILETLREAQLQGKVATADQAREFLRDLHK